MNTVIEHRAGLDVHKASVMATASMAQGGDETRTYPTMASSLIVLRDWLLEQGITHVALEATGVYWKPIWAVFEGHFKQMLLVNPRHMKNVPGRKTDVKDSQWIHQLLGAGLLQGSFVPTKEIRDLREPTRYRKALIGEKTRTVNRLHKALEHVGIKLDCVVSDIQGKAARRILDAIVQGMTDPEKLSRLGGKRLRATPQELCNALDGYVEPMHSKMIGSILMHIDALNQEIKEFDDMIEKQTDPYESYLKLIRSVPGVGERTAQNILAEIGTDISRWPTAKHFASWAGVCPGNHESAGKTRSGKTRRGPKHLNNALHDAAMAASVQKGTYLYAQYRRLLPKKGHKRALGAVKHSIVVSLWYMLTNGEMYVDLGEDYFRKRDPERLTRHLVAQLELLGHKVILEPAQPEPTEPESVQPELAQSVQPEPESVQPELESVQQETVQPEWPEWPESESKTPEPAHPKPELADLVPNAHQSRSTVHVLQTTGRVPHTQ